MRLRTAVFILGCAGAASVFDGCAHTSVKQFDATRHEQKELDNRGVRFYQNAPFILVYSDKGKYQSEIVYLPDTSTIHSARPYQLFASGDMNLVLKDGVLTKISESGDSTVVATSFIEAAKAVAIGQVQAQTQLAPLESANAMQHIEAIKGVASGTPAAEAVAEADSGEEVVALMAEGGQEPQALIKSSAVLGAIQFIEESADRCASGNVQRSLSSQLSRTAPNLYIFRLGTEQEDSGAWKPVLYSANTSISLAP